MREEYYGCFSNGECKYYGYSEYTQEGGFVFAEKCDLNDIVYNHGNLIAKWTVRFKTKNI